MTMYTDVRSAYGKNARKLGILRQRLFAGYMYGTYHLALPGLNLVFASFCDTHVRPGPVTASKDPDGFVALRLLS